MHLKNTKYEIEGVLISCDDPLSREHPNRIYSVNYGWSAPEINPDGQYIVKMHHELVSSGEYQYHLNVTLGYYFEGQLSTKGSGGLIMSTGDILEKKLMNLLM